MIGKTSGETLDLFDIHRKKLIRILHLNSDIKDIDDFHQDRDGYVWSILIYDQFTKDSVSTLFKVGNLRSDNITLDLILSSTREKLHGVNALYLVQPTTENINYIIADIANDLYDAMYINFTYPVDPETLQKLANAVGKYSATSKIRQIYQHHLNFVTLSSDHFTFYMKQTYAQLKTLAEEPKARLLDQIAISLFSVLRTLGIVPMIHYQSGLGQEIAMRLEVNCALNRSRLKRSI